VMSSDILGDEFDIHGGGIDLIFPHHENEIAQSEGLGKKFARYWMHHGLLTINGQKMAKSLGNFVTVKDFLNKYGHADLLKLLFLSTHYSHPVDYTDDKIHEARQALDRISILWGKISSPAEKEFSGNIPAELENIKNKFINAMDDDFNTPQGLAAIFELVSITNKKLEHREFVSAARDILLELTSLFGLDLGSAANMMTPDSGLVMPDVEVLIQARNQARKNKDFRKSDEIRRKLEEAGIVLEDTKEGTTWRRKL
jgi:cysteinyl-tRNA synthetase